MTNYHLKHGEPSDPNGMTDEQLERDMMLWLPNAAKFVEKEQYEMYHILRYLKVYLDRRMK